MAADQNVSFAQFVLGACYLKGLGTNQNTLMAALYLQKAADNGVPQAKKLLNVLKKL